MYPTQPLLEGIRQKYQGCSHGRAAPRAGRSICSISMRRKTVIFPFRMSCWSIRWTICRKCSKRRCRKLEELSSNKEIACIFDWIALRTKRSPTSNSTSFTLSWRRGCWNAPLLEAVSKLTESRSIEKTTKLSWKESTARSTSRSGKSSTNF